VKGWEGAIAVCPHALDGWFVSPEYRTFRGIPSEVVPEYLTHLVSTPWFRGKLATLTRGVGARRERIRPELFLALEVEMAPRSAQEQLLGVFNRLDALKKLQSDTAAELDALLPSILDKAFKGEL